jgi:hypothetical protein
MTSLVRCSVQQPFTSTQSSRLPKSAYLTNNMQSVVNHSLAKDSMMSYNDEMQDYNHNSRQINQLTNQSLTGEPDATPSNEIQHSEPQITDIQISPTSGGQHHG